MTRSLDAEDLSVVIPSGPGWERWPVLERTLESLRAQTVSGFETILVVDGTAEAPGGLQGVRVLAKEHAGPGPRRNAGAEASERPIVLLLGDDMLAAPDLVERHVERHAEDPAPQTAVLGHVDWHPEVAAGRLQRWLDWSGAQFDYSHIVGGVAGYGRFYSSNLSIKRDFMLEVGGFDETFTFGYEDTDLGLRLHERGLRLLYEPTARTWHLHRYTWPALQKRFFLMGEGELTMVRKHPEFPSHFLDRIHNRRRVAPFTPWPWVVDFIPKSMKRLRREAETRADAWYFKHLGPAFLAGWDQRARTIDTREHAVADGLG